MRIFPKCLRWFLFILFLFLGVAQLPTYIGRFFLLMAALACPIRPVVWFVNEMLRECSRRWFWFLLLLISMSRLPAEAFGEAGKRMGLFLRGVLELFCIK